MFWITCNTFVGANSVILPGVTIGSNVVIGAGSVVTKDISDNCVAFGSPAKAVCGSDSFKKKHSKLMTETPHNYVK